MVWSLFHATLHGASSASSATIIATLLVLSFVSCRISESSRPTLMHRGLSPNTKSESQSVSPPSLEGQHYIKNTLLRSNLTENQPGLPLSIAITVIDTTSCAPVENALVEIWGSNNQGAYSGSSDDCSSWLRGGLATDAEGTATFNTIYPGPESKRAPHLYAIVRTDWFEVAGNKTIDSDSVQHAAATGQIFFPNDLNDQVYKDSNYKAASTKAVKNEADPCHQAGSSCWNAQTEPFASGTNGGIRAHLTISFNINDPPKIEIGPAPARCTPQNTTSSDTAEPSSHPQADLPISAATFTQPPVFPIMMIINMMLLYIFYGGYSSSNRQDSKSQNVRRKERITYPHCNKVMDARIQTPL